VGKLTKAPRSNTLTNNQISYIYRIIPSGRRTEM